MPVKFESLVELCEESCRSYADRQLFGVKEGPGWTWITYARFHELVDAFRGGLASLGIGRGDKVAIIADNRVEWAVACYATYGLGASFVPMYEAQLAKEWHFIIEDCAAKAAIGATNAIAEQLRTMRAEIPTLEHVIGLELPASDDHSYAALLEAGRARPVPAGSPKGEDVAGLIYTSGTTGHPKGVILTHGNICSNVNAIHQIFPFDPDDRSLAFLPWAHSFGQTCELHCLVSMGCSMAINDDVKNLVPNLAEVKPTVLYAVPRIFNRIYEGVNEQIAARPGIIQRLFKRGIDAAKRKARGEPVGAFDQLVLTLADKLVFSKVRERFGGRLKYAISGSAALNADVAEFIDALGITVYEGYGLTETSPIATANYPETPQARQRRARDPGRVDRDRPFGHRRPEARRDHRLRPERDAGLPQPPRRDRRRPHGGRQLPHRRHGLPRPDGYLYITGRIKEQYKLENGKYVVPAPLEEQLKLSPYIANVMIYGANKPYNVALIVPDSDALRTWAERQGITLGDVRTNKQVHDLIRSEIENLSKDIKGYERVQDFVLVLEDFTTDNGMLTPTLKVKRRVVLDRYGQELDALY